LTARSAGNQDERQNRGVAASAQFVYAPWIEGGLNYGYANNRVFTPNGNLDTTATGEAPEPWYVAWRNDPTIHLAKGQPVYVFSSVFAPIRQGWPSNPSYVYLRTQLSGDQKLAALALSEPLRQTLPLTKPPLPTDTDTKEAATIDRLTLPAVYSYNYQQLQDASALLVLDPFQT
jgi:hypothetical protein